MTNKKQKQLYSYYVQLFVLCLVLIATYYAFVVVFQLIAILKDQSKTNVLERKIRLNSEIGALLILISNAYFCYLALTTYRKNRSRANYIFLIASGLVLIAAFAKYFTIKNGNNVVTGVEDI